MSTKYTCDVCEKEFTLGLTSVKMFPRFGGANSTPKQFDICSKCHVKMFKPVVEYQWFFRVGIAAVDDDDMAEGKVT